MGTRDVVSAGAGGVSGGAIVTGLAQFTTFAERLDSIDTFLDTSLFLTLMGISLAAAGLLSAAADQRRIAAESAFLHSHNVSRYNKLIREAQQIAHGASYFLVAFVPAMAGLFSCVGFDAFFESLPVGEGDPVRALTGVVALLNSEYSEELVEAIVGGSFLGANLWMMFLGFLGANRAFVNPVNQKQQQAEPNQREKLE